MSISYLNYFPKIRIVLNSDVTTELAITFVVGLCLTIVLQIYEICMKF